MAFTSSRFTKLASHLPFPLEATDQVNEAFRRWQEKGSSEAKRVIDLWSYCYIFRYFLIKSTKGDLQEVSDADALVGTAYQRVQENRCSVQDPSRYASWVSVVCRNTLLNYFRRRAVTYSIDDEEGPTLVADTPPAHHDVGFTHQLLDEAVERLPSYLQEVAQLYFFENRDYEEISIRLDKPVPTVRSYKHKLIRKLREDPHISTLLDELGQVSDR